MISKQYLCSDQVCAVEWLGDEKNYNIKSFFEVKQSEEYANSIWVGLALLIAQEKIKVLTVQRT